MKDRTSSNREWFDKMKRLIPFGSSTCSKAARYLPDEPGVVVRGKGCRVWDADGNEYIDFRNSLGPVTLGYAHPAIDEAIKKQLEEGIVFGHPHPLECEVAEMISRMVPGAERVRFLKTGGEAVAACIRIVRAYTGRDHIIQIGYNGWLNCLAPDGVFMPGKISRSIPAGVPECLSRLHHGCGWNDVETLEMLFQHLEGKVAAVVVASDYEHIEQGGEFYPWLSALAEQHGALLVFDEIVTGFRVADGGIQEYFDVVPDLSVFAKGVANGMPLSVYCGRKEVMDVCEERQVSISSTLGGETLSLAAAKVALELIQNGDVIESLWEKGEKMWGGLNGLFERYGLPVRMKGFWVCPQLVFLPDAGPELPEEWFRAAYRNGVSMYSVGYVNYSHEDGDIAEALERLEEAIVEVKRNDVGRQALIGRARRSKMISRTETEGNDS